MTGLYIQFSDDGRQIWGWSSERFDGANAFAFRIQPPEPLPTDDVDVGARAAAQSLGFGFDEQCGHETEADECNSPTCIGGLNEDHHPDDCRETMRKMARAVLAATQEQAT